MRKWVATVLLISSSIVCYAASPTNNIPNKAKVSSSYTDCVNKKFEVFMNAHQEEIIKKMLSGTDQAKIQRMIVEAENDAKSSCKKKD